MANENRYRCPVCRTRRTSWDAYVRHCMTCRPVVCTCGGYPYPHKPATSKCCEQHPMAVLHSAERAGEPQEVLDDIALELALAGVGKKATTCPF